MIGLTSEIESITLLGSILFGIVSILLILVKDQRKLARSIHGTDSEAHIEGVSVTLREMVNSLVTRQTYIQATIEELVDAQRDFAKKGWQTLPDDIATGARLTETIRELQAHDRHIDARVDRLSRELSRHLDAARGGRLGED